MKNIAIGNLLQIKDLLGKLSEKNYRQQIDILSGATLGQHIRHILEFYLLLVSGSFSGIISYDKRKRDIRIEENPKLAIQTIDQLIKGLDTLDEKQLVKFEGDYTADGKKQNLINSSVGRELAYCIEHSIHHQALLKTALIVIGLQTLIDENFGVAYSTIRYRNNSCAQ